VLRDAAADGGEARHLFADRVIGFYSRAAGAINDARLVLPERPGFNGRACGARIRHIEVGASGRGVSGGSRQPLQVCARHVARRCAERGMEAVMAITSSPRRGRPHQRAAKGVTALNPPLSPEGRASDHSGRLSEGAAGLTRMRGEAALPWR